MSGVHGLYRASVLRNDDPAQRYRLQVLAPALSNDPLPWAEACTPSAEFSVPKAGDTVWIMFEAGDLQFPVWIGILSGHVA